MTRRHSMRLLLACSVAASFGTAHAGPEDCLTLRDNIAVAGCADRYAPGTSATLAPSVRQPTRTAHQPIQTAEQWLLHPVPTARTSAAVAPKRETPEVVAERDRSELIRRSELGAVGLAAMGLVFGVWRWRSTMIKSCSYCGTRVTPGSAVCKRCFRSV
jgi:hypothetical protein